tara:strand:+ start:690 stop:800 length:111 start_codon:yes stop_codon:yes gene_type:complete
MIKLKIVEEIAIDDGSEGWWPRKLKSITNKMIDIIV